MIQSNSCTSTRRSISCRLLLLPALVAGLTLGVAGGASAEAGLFQATIAGNIPKPTPCATGAFFCGRATTNYGVATWNLTPTSETPPPPGVHCGSYEATVTFGLADASSSMLVLDEAGGICPPPGNSFVAPGASNSYGNPFYFTSSWTVETATGAFGSIPVGTAGTDALHAAGAHVSGTYTTS